MPSTAHAVVGCAVVRGCCYCVLEEHSLRLCCFVLQDLFTGLQAFVRINMPTGLKWNPSGGSVAAAMAATCAAAPAAAVPQPAPAPAPAKPAPGGAKGPPPPPPPPPANLSELLLKERPSGKPAAAAAAGGGMQEVLKALSQVCKQGIATVRHEDIAQCGADMLSDALAAANMLLQTCAQLAGGKRRLRTCAHSSLKLRGIAALNSRFVVPLGCPHRTRHMCLLLAGHCCDIRPAQGDR
jgi:hypothetical protein